MDTAKSTKTKATSSWSKKTSTRSIKSVKSNISSNQSTMSQFYTKVAKPNVFTASPQTYATKPMRSVFDVYRRVEPIKNVLYSPDIFTQTQASPKPPSLYNFDYAESNTSPSFDDSMLSNGSKTAANLPNTESPALSVTPIQSKINEQRNAQNAVNGFVCANAIFGPSPIKSKQGGGNGSGGNSSENSFVDDSDDEFDALLLDINEELINANGNIANGFVRTIPLKKAEKPHDTFLKALNVNSNLNFHAEKPIQIDFETSCSHPDNSNTSDAIESSNSNLNLQKESFFAIDDSTVNPEISAPVESKPRRNFSSIPESNANINGTHSQHSTSSNQAVFGSPMAKMPADHLKKRKSVSKQVSLDAFTFNAPPQLQHPKTNLPQNNMQQRAEFMAVDSQPIEQKKKKLSIGDLMAVGAKKRSEFEQKVKSLRSVLNCLHGVNSILFRILLNFNHTSSL